MNDLLMGEKRIPINEFNTNWQASGARGVVVAPSPIPTIPDSAAPLFAGMGAAAALLALAALGTARKGLGAGRTDEGEGTWADYSWREPPAQPVETWANYASYTLDPPEETWFDSRVYDEGAHEQTAPAPSSSESSQVEMTPDAGVNDAPAINTQATQTTEQGWGAKSDAELMAEAEKEAAQRRKEIKTIEDAKKVAEEDANKALEAFMLQSSGTAGIKTVSSGISLVNPNQFANFKSQPSIAPCIYIVNGINSTAPSGTPDPLLRQLEFAFEKRRYPEVQVTTTNVIYNTGKDHPDQFLLNTLTGILEVLGENTLGSFGQYTQQVYDFINKDIHNNPACIGKPILIAGHSGGGQVSTNVAEMLKHDGQNVIGIVTMGSPSTSAYSVADPLTHILEIRDTNDLFGTPVIRNRGVENLILGPLGTSVARTINPNLNIYTETTGSGQTNTFAAHSSYITNSNETINLIKKYFPTIGLLLDKK